SWSFRSRRSSRNGSIRFRWAGGSSRYPHDPSHATFPPHPHRDGVRDRRAPRDRDPRHARPEVLPRPDRHGVRGRFGRALRLDPGGKPVAGFGVDGLAIVNFGKQESANAVAFAPSGAIDIGGYASNGVTMRSALARLRPAGTLDPAFAGNGKLLLDLSPGAEQVNDLVVLPRGDIVAAGYAESATMPRFAI